MHREHMGNRPTPHKDGIHRLLRKEHCGFQDREQLDWWFQGHKRALDRERFNIALYAVPSTLVRYGERQLVFERGDLIPVERMPVVRQGKVYR